MGTSERPSPEEELDKNAGLYTAGQVSRRCREGKLLFFVGFFFFFLFLQKCDGRRGAAGNTGTGMERGAGGRLVCRAAEVEEDEEKQQWKAWWLSPRARKSSRESTRKIVTVLSRNYILSRKDTFALFFTSGKDEM